jgi:hypothetical protein
MTAGALKGQPKKSRGHGLHTIGHVFHSVLLLHTTTFTFLLMQAIKGRR